jgi:hypothetical protein
MKILHVDLGKELRGGQHQALLLMEALAARGHQQALVARRGSPLLAEARRRGWKAGSSFPPGPWDLYHAHDAQAHTRVALRGTKVPLVVSRRVAFPLRRGWLSRIKYRRAAHYVAVSQFVRGQLLDAGIPAKQVTVVYDGVTLPDIADAAAKRGQFRSQHRIAAGAFVAGALPSPPEKPGRIFLRAAAHQGIQSLVAAPPDLAAFFFALDVFVYLSESEGLGSGILMAMAHGLPVIASRTGGIPEIVRDGETGILVRNTEADVAQALQRLAAHAALRQAMGAAGRDWTARHATDAIMAAQTEAVYCQVLGSQR